MDEQAEPDLYGKPGMDPIIKIFGFKYLSFSGLKKIYIIPLFLGDLLARMLYGRKRPSPVAGRLQHIVVAKVDQLGDLLMATPVLHALKKNCSGVKLTLLTGSWNRSLALWLLESKVVDKIIWVDFAGCNRSSTRWMAWKQEWVTKRQALAELRMDIPDVFLELRPRSPHSLSLGCQLKGARIIGFGLRGLAFTLDAEIEYSDQVPLGQLFLKSLNKLGMNPGDYERPILPEQNPDNTIFDHIGVKPKNYGVIHAFSRDSKREIRISMWDRLLGASSKDLQWVYVGTTEEESTHVEFAALARKHGVISAAGKTSYRESALLIQEAKCALCIDSMVAHLALAYAVPATVLMVPGVSVRMSYPKLTANMKFSNGDNPEEIVIALMNRAYSSTLQL